MAYRGMAQPNLSESEYPIRSNEQRLRVLAFATETSRPQHLEQ
jgi:hypothetical protein